MGQQSSIQYKEHKINYSKEIEIKIIINTLISYIHCTNMRIGVYYLQCISFHTIYVVYFDFCVRNSRTMVGSCRGRGWYSVVLCGDGG